MWKQVYSVLPVVMKYMRNFSEKNLTFIHSKPIGMTNCLVHGALAMLCYGLEMCFIIFNNYCI